MAAKRKAPKETMPRNNNNDIGYSTELPFGWKYRAMTALIGAKLEKEDPPCGLEDVIDALALREMPDDQTNFPQESSD